MTIGVIGGTGGQGLGIAVRFVEAGEEVIIGSRTLEKAQAAVDKVKELLPNATNVRAMENSDAAKAADVLVLTVPLAAQKSTLLSIKEGAAGKPLMDATGPLESCIGGSATKYIELPRLCGGAVPGDPAGRKGDLCVNNNLPTWFMHLASHRLRLSHLRRRPAAKAIVTR